MSSMCVLYTHTQCGRVPTTCARVGGMWVAATYGRGGVATTWMRRVRPRKCLLHIIPITHELTPTHGVSRPSAVHAWLISANAQHASHTVCCVHAATRPSYHASHAQVPRARGRMGCVVRAVGCQNVCNGPLKAHGKHAQVASEAAGVPRLGRGGGRGAGGGGGGGQPRRTRDRAGARARAARGRDRSDGADMRPEAGIGRGGEAAGAGETAS